MHRSLIFTLLALSGLATAETPSQIADRYAAGASPKRGGEFYARKFGISDKMPACTACHTDDPARPGRHAVTGKDIKPLSPSANPERFTDAAKVEKWFKRNCKEVVGRECTPGEKADFIAYVTEGR
jgi:hypothetical protein